VLTRQIEPALAVIAALWASSSTAAAAAGPQTEVVTPGPGYGGGWFKRVFLGGQWRDAWTTPIEVPVLNLKTFDGGVRPIRRGGGLQTKNLHLKNAQGGTWVFRSVDKDVSGLLDPETLRSIFGDILQDLTSTIHPAAALMVPPFLEAAGVVHAHPRLAVMPDDPQLGQFRPVFAHMLGLLEERNDKDEMGADKIVDSLDLFVRLETRRNEEVDARNYLRARLVDVLVGDWDRHLDQWVWARFDEDGKRVWRPIPRDRDQAFSRFGGLLPSLGEYYTKQLAGFGDTYAPIDKLTFAGRFTDRRLLVWLDRATWESETTNLVSKVTDQLIANAVHQQPPEMYAKGGAELERELRSRRDRLAEASRDYYRLLASNVDLRAAEGETIRVRREPRGIEVSTPRFHRLFVPDETSELRVYTPRGGSVVEEGSGGGIKVRIVPPDPREPEPIRKRYEPVRDWGQDLLFYPLFSYDTTRGVFPGVLAELTSYGFELDPFASKMGLSFAWATAVNRPRAVYSAEFRTHSPLSALVGLMYSGVEVLNFFGLGNQTPRIDAFVDSNFYQVKQEQFLAFPGLQWRLGRPARVYGGILLRHISALQNSSFASGAYGSTGMTLASGEAGIELDTKSGVLTKLRGFRLRLAVRHTPDILDARTSSHVAQGGGAFTKLHGSASASFGGHILTDVFLDLHLAGERNWGRYPFYDAAFLGGTTIPTELLFSGIGGLPLRGFDYNRFAGDSAVVMNTELKIGIGKFLALLPWRYGISGVADIGRVFLANDPSVPSGETSSRWHHGVGGGVWLAVFAATPGLEFASAINALIVRSDERTAFYISGGFGL